MKERTSTPIEAAVSLTMRGRLLASSKSADVRAKTRVGHQKVHHSVSRSLKQSKRPVVHVPRRLPVASALRCAISIYDTQRGQRYHQL